MIFYNPTVTSPAQICTLQYDPTTGEGVVLLGENPAPDTPAVPLDQTLTCTTVEEYTILKMLGYEVRLNPDPSHTTLHGVDQSEGVHNVGSPRIAPETV